MSKKRIGILTGGGDVPGLNTVIRDVTYRAYYEGYDVIGIRRGWGGLIYMDPDGKKDDNEHILHLDRQKVRKIGRTGGTILRTSRTNPLKVTTEADLLKYRGLKFDKKTDLTTDVLKNLDRLGIEVLIAIGGDDTLSYAAHLDKLGFKVIGVPKTMDNDVNGTEYCIGFSTAISKSLVLINDLRTPMGSHERFGIIELFGRNAGFTGLFSAYVSAADRVVIPEVDFDPDHLVDLLEKDKENNPSNYAVLLVSEGAKPIGGKIIEGGAMDDYGHKKLGGIGFEISEFKKKKTGYLTIVQLATTFANIAMDSIFNGESGLLTAIVNGRYDTVPIGIVAEQKRVVDVETLYNVERYRPKYENMKGLPLFLQ